MQRVPPQVLPLVGMQQHKVRGSLEMSQVKWFLQPTGSAVDHLALALTACMKFDWFSAPGQIVCLHCCTVSFGILNCLVLRNDHCLIGFPHGNIYGWLNLYVGKATTAFLQPAFFPIRLLVGSNPNTPARFWGGVCFVFGRGERMESVSWKLFCRSSDSQILATWKWPYVVWSPQFYSLVIQCGNGLKLLELMETWATTDFHSVKGLHHPSVTFQFGAPGPQTPGLWVALILHLV